jgi:hypothetical protein
MGCHMHGSVQFCMVGSEEWEVTTEVDPSSAPDSYGGCHAHGDTELCVLQNVSLYIFADTSVDTAQTATLRSLLWR